MPKTTTDPHPATTWYCRRGHFYTSPIPVYTVQCGTCNKTHPKQGNLMHPRPQPTLKGTK